MKAFTDIEQSKNLSKILPPDSADMCYRIVAYNPNDTHVYQPYCFVGTLESDIPCWSLTALLDVFPCSKESPIVNLTRGGWIPSFTRRWFATWEDEDKNVFYSGDGITPVDAVVELILKLHEQKLL